MAFAAVATFFATVCLTAQAMQFDLEVGRTKVCASNFQSLALSLLKSSFPSSATAVPPGDHDKT
jgi:hypothetical protein